MLKAQMLASILLLAMPACVPFAGGRPIVTPSAAGCSALVPQEWRQGVEPVALPEGETVGDWIVAFDGQTGRLDMANSRTQDAVGIVERCEERDATAVRRATRRRVLGIF